MRTVKQHKPNNDQGFTLIELLVVIVIIGILIAVAIPLYSNYKEHAGNQAAQLSIKSAVPVIEQCATENVAHHNAYPSGTITGTTGVDITLNAATNGCNAVLHARPGVKLTYTGEATNFTLTAGHKDSRKLYTYDSNTRKTVSSP